MMVGVVAGERPPRQREAAAGARRASGARAHDGVVA
jgi:hypothetical protein